MPIDTVQYQKIRDELAKSNVTLIAVSKTKPVEDIEALMALGQADFGENYVQELADKQGKIKDNIRWHFIGHLQSNKVKQIISYVHLIHSIDSLKLLQAINKQAEKINRVVDCLLQVHIAQEETKYGLDETELNEVFQSLSSMQHVNIKGFMGMATFTQDVEQVRSEYRYLKQLYDKFRLLPQGKSFNILSMGMSGDYKIAVAEGSTMVRIGSLIFGERNYGAK